MLLPLATATLLHRSHCQMAIRFGRCQACKDNASMHCHSMLQLHCMDLIWFYQVPDTAQLWQPRRFRAWRRHSAIQCSSVHVPTTVFEHCSVMMIFSRRHLIMLPVDTRSFLTSVFKANDLCCFGGRYFCAMLRRYLAGEPVFNCIDNALGY